MMEEQRAIGKVVNIHCVPHAQIGHKEQIDSHIIAQVVFLRILSFPLIERVARAIS